MNDHRGPLARLTRRLVTVPAVGVAAVGLTLTAPLWFPASAVYDLVRGRFRLPTTRLLSFGVLWAWIECAGIARSFRLWVSGRGRDQDAHYELMAWWTATLMAGLERTTGLRVEVSGEDAIERGDALVLSRHASLADSLVSAWMLCCRGGLHPRYVLKRELLFDPCLDIVGLRVPCYFLDREAVDGDRELDEITLLAHGLDSRTVAVIFPEGTRAAPAKRTRALDKIGARDPARAVRMGALRHLLPPRPAGTRALASGAPDADIILVWHTGFDGLDTFGGILAKMSERPRPARLVARRVPRHEVPSGADFDQWLDDQWLRMDSEVDAELDASN